MWTFLKTLVRGRSPKAVESQPQVSRISREQLDAMTFPEIVEVARDTIARSGGATLTYAEVSALEQRVHSIAVYDNHVPDEQREAALQLLETLTADVEKAIAGNAEAMAAHKVAKDIRSVNTRRMGCGTLAWRLAEYSISGADVIPYIMKPENRDLVEDFFATVPADTLAAAKPECVRQLILQSPHESKNAVLILHGLAANGDKAATAVFTTDELRALLNVPDDYNAGRDVLVSLKMLPAVSAARPFMRTSELQGVVAKVLQEWAARSEADYCEINIGEEKKYALLISLNLLRIELARAQLRQIYGEEISLTVDSVFKSQAAAQAVNVFRHTNQALRPITPGTSVDLALLNAVMGIGGITANTEEARNDRKFCGWAAKRLNSERVEFVDYFRFLLRFVSDRAARTKGVSVDEHVESAKQAASKHGTDANDAEKAVYGEDALLPQFGVNRQIAVGTAAKSQNVKSFALQSGRRVELNAFYFEETYAGLMAGLPENEPGYITSQEAKAQAIWGSRKTYTISPITIIRKYCDRNYESWPRNCYQAWLTSEAMDSRDVGSQLVVIWFGDGETDLSLLTMVEQACREVPWEQYAEAFNF